MKENKDKYFSMAQVSRELNIELVVLKKISYFVEKTMKKKDYYYRNSKNQRLYDSDQIDEIEEIIEIKRNNNVSYSTVIHMKFSNNNSEIVPRNERYQWFQNIEMILSEQEESLKKLTISVEALELMENHNFKIIRQMNDKIDEILNYVKISRTQNKKKDTKKRLATNNMEISKKTLIRKTEIKELRDKIIYLPSIWNDRKDRIEMSSIDIEYYTEYVENSKNAYDQAIKHRKKLGHYYIVSNEAKEVLIWYGQFYDYLIEK